MKCFGLSTVGSFCILTTQNKDWPSEFAHYHSEHWERFFFSLSRFVNFVV